MLKNKMFRTSLHKLLILVILATAVMACRKEETNKVLFANDIKTSERLKVGESITLTPSLMGKAKSYEWIENGEVLSTSSSYVFTKALPGDYELTFNVINAAGKNTLVYNIKVVGRYADGILLLSSTDANGTGGANLSFLNEKEELKLDVFSLENNGAKLSASAMGAFRYGNQLYISGSGQPDYITVVNDETLKATSNITVSGISGITYFATTNGKTGYVNSSTRRKLGLYPVDLTAKTIGATSLNGTTDAALLPITTINSAILVPVAKQLVKVENGMAQTLYTHTENVAGVVKTANKQLWMGVQGINSKAKLIRLDDNLAVLETVELETTFKLPANGILTASGADEFIYWQETSTGEFCRFSTTTKKAEKFINPMNDGLSFATAWKVNPQNGEFFILDSPGIFTGSDSTSDLYIYTKYKKFRKKISKVGYQVVDIIFPK
ncbi:DUF5074 domain-containing protein [Pedobacter sp. ASV28]|uniref:DUF5074 domain-containing protein n=1 Tax=Pedobacter sp. ASV28 TaxID=2795123 RepID=UPI0018EBA924|nr:DUF5074 domain-containing protein [Pedobacter sp. ASV28]